MNLSNYIRPWLSYMVARLVEITTPEVLGDAFGPCSTLQSSAYGERISAAITIAAPSQTTNPSH